MNLLDTLKGIAPDAIKREAARRRLLNFARYIQPRLDIQPFHHVYYEILDRFAHGRIRRLIVQMPPQHGKSQGSSRLLPAFLLGLDGDRKISIASYSATVARDFNRDVQRIMDSDEFRMVFPGVRMGAPGTGYVRTADMVEIAGSGGWLRSVGRGGSLTSKTVDISILDDVYKDYAEANSPLIRESAWKWYTTVVRTRLHNDSQELIVFTRWHEDDLIGRIEESGETIVDARLIEGLRGRCEELERAASAGTATRVEVRTVVRDSIVRDTVLPCLSYDDGWMSLSGCVENGVFDGSVVSRDTLLLFCNVRYRRFLWWKTSRVKSRTWRVVSRNPYTAVCGYEVVEIAQ